MTAYPPFNLSFSGTSFVLKVGPGNVFNTDGTALAFAGGSLTVDPSVTRLVYLDPATGDLAVSASLDSSLGLLVGQFLSGRVGIEAVFNADRVIAANQFHLSASAGSLVVHVGAGALTFSDGTQAEVAAQSITLPANSTRHLMIDLQTLGIRALRRAIHDGGVFIGTVTTGGSGVTAATKSNDFAVPPSPIERFKRRLLLGRAVRVILLGDSLTHASGSGTMWHNQLFNATYAANGFNVENVASVTWTNYAFGGTTAQYGCGVVGRAITNPANGVFRLMGFGWHNYPETAGRDQVFASALNDSAALREQPDLAIVGFAANNGTYEAEAVEAIVRTLRGRGIEVILHTSNSQSADLSANGADGLLWKDLAEAYNCALADTWAYVNEVNDAGTDTFADTVHQNQDGWDEWSRALRSVINDRPQRGRQALQPLPSVLGSATAASGLRLFDRSEFVTVPCQSTGGTEDSTLDATAIPQCFGVSATGAIKAVASGEYADFSHAHFLAADLIIERGFSSSFGADIQLVTAGGVSQTLRSVSHTDDANNLPKVIEACTLADSLTTQQAAWYPDTRLPGHFINGAIRVNVTSGEAKILGVLFHTLETAVIPLQSFPTWTSGRTLEAATFETAPTTNWGPARYTDTDLAHFEIPFFGRGIGLAFAASTAGGLIDIYIDGVLVHSQLETYAASGSFPRFINLFPDATAGGADFTRPAREHVCIIRRNGRNGSSDASPATGKRRLSLFRAVRFI